MWPLSIFLFVATAAPQQKPLGCVPGFSSSEITCHAAQPVR